MARRFPDESRLKSNYRFQGAHVGFESSVRRAGSNAARNFVPPWRLNPAWYRTNLTQSVENFTAGL